MKIQRGIMNGNQKFWIAVLFIASLVICSIAWAIAWGATAVDREAVRNGLVEIEYQSNVFNGTKWGKQ